MLFSIFPGTEGRGDTRRWRHGPVSSQRRKLFRKLEWIPAPVATKKEKEDGRSASWKRVWIISSLFKPSYEWRVSAFWEHDSSKIEEL